MLLSVPGLADITALTVGNAYLIPADESNADKPWKTLTIDIDGKDCLFICKDVIEPKHVQNIVPADTFDSVGIKHLFRYDPPPAEFCQYILTQGYGHLLGLEPPTSRFKATLNRVKLWLTPHSH
jgi:hypothetical protein